MNAANVEAVIEVHAEHAADTWANRCEAVHRPDYNLVDLKLLDHRISENLYGLEVAGPGMWDVVGESLDGGNPASVFVAAAVALKTNDAEWTSKVLETVADEPSASALASAIAWVGHDKGRRLSDQLLASDDPMQLRAGLASNAIQGIAVDSAMLKRGDIVAHPRFLKSVGETGSSDLRRYCAAQLTSEDIATRFWAAWSSRLLGDKSANAVLMDIAVSEPDYAEQACGLIARGVDYAASADWLNRLAAKPERQRLALITAGSIGDPVLIPWLIDFMSIEDSAPAAGAALSLITGVDLEFEDLTVDSAESEEEPPAADSEASDDAESDDLPCPDRSRVKQWWAANEGQFRAGKRYLAGKPIDKENLWAVLGAGLQQQRAAAALELALLEPGKALFNVSAKADDQARWLRGQS